MEQAELLLESWIKLTCLIKNSRMTKDLSYNEALIMFFLYKQHEKDPTQAVAVKDLLKNTGMIKSLLNRTLNTLEKKELLKRIRNTEDKRALYVQCIPENLEQFLKVHRNSVSIAGKIIDLIGKKDSELFINIIHKLLKKSQDLGEFYYDSFQKE